MSNLEIISLVVTIIGVLSLAVLFTLLFGNYSKSAIKEVNEGERDIELIDKSLKENTKKGKSKKRVSSIVSKVIFWLFIILFVPLFVYSMIYRVQDKIPTFGGKSVLVVGSGSMSYKNDANPYLEGNNLNNQFSTYDMIVIEKVDTKDSLKLYDVVAYYNPELKETVIHRIIQINDDSTYTTRGDANNASDSYNCSFSDIQGRYTGTKIKVIGVFIMFFQSAPGIITLVGILYILLLIDRDNGKIDEATTSRATLLMLSLNEKTADSSTLTAGKQEIISYQGYYYYFNEKGFVKKEKAADPPKEDEKTVIKKLEITSPAETTKKEK
jgi:signal peptidase I